MGLPSTVKSLLNALQDRYHSSEAVNRALEDLLDDSLERSEALNRLVEANIKEVASIQDQGRMHPSSCTLSSAHPTFPAHSDLLLKHSNPPLPTLDNLPPVRPPPPPSISTSPTRRDSAIAPICIA